MTKKSELDVIFQRAESITMVKMANRTTPLKPSNSIAKLQSRHVLQAVC